MPNVAVMGLASVALERNRPLSRLLSRWISRLFHHGCCVLGARGYVTLTIECAKTAASSVSREREGESSLSSLSRSLSLRPLRSWRSGVVTLTLSANSVVDARRRAWPVNFMVKAPFPPFPVLFLHGCCVLVARGNVTLLRGTWPWPWVRTAASTP